MKRAILFNAFLLLTATAIAVADGALDVSTGFFGGTVPNATTFASPVVFTGDNSGGTGTVRIRPSDEDTQLVLCDASNNASPEVCSNWQHYNPSANAAGSFFATNLYLNSASTLACANGAVGSGYFQTYASNTQGQAVIGMRHPGGACSSANLVLSCITTGATTATCTWGSGHTTTTDFRGPILNGGSATCNGISAGAMCINETATVLFSSGATQTLHVGSSAAASSTQIWEYTQGTAGQATTLFVTGSMVSPTVIGAVGYYGSTYTDADYADDVGMTGVGKEISFIRTDNPAAGSIHTKWTDDASASATLAGTTLMTLDGAGNLFLNTGATRTKGTITLVAGTGTATVSSGCTPACSDTTAVNAVQCSVSGTTLTANGTGTDVISYVCL